MQDSPHPRQGQEGRHLRFLPSDFHPFPNVGVSLEKRTELR